MCCISLVRCVLVLRCGSAGWCGVLMQAEALLIKLVYLYSTIRMMHSPINLRFIILCHGWVRKSVMCRTYYNW